MTDLSEHRLSLLVPKRLVKAAKDALQAQRMLDKGFKIRPVSNSITSGPIPENGTKTRDACFHIRTIIRPNPAASNIDALHDLLNLIGMQEHGREISLVSSAVINAADACDLPGEHGSVHRKKNPLARTISQWLATKQGNKPQIAKDALAECHWSFTVYPPLLLLPASDFDALRAGLQTNPISTEFSSLYRMLCKEFKITHIALNAPIPAALVERLSSQDRTTNKQLVADVVHSAPNVLRSPTGLTPLYGDFGSALPLTHNPTHLDFQSAFWATVIQNGIFQTWAPRYTMFSRGNITEKARVLRLGSLTKELFGVEPHQVSAVDLYAGIGYFAFSYAKSGIGKVLCWEINPWSIEGLKRGAKGNKWEVQTFEAGEVTEMEDLSDSRIYIFKESNESATKRLDAIRPNIPPIVHINCGYLPSSKDSWETAVQMLDPAGGWIHVHENIAKKDIESRIFEIVEVFTGLVKNFPCCIPQGEHSVECKHVELVKSYAPGVMHCVLDIAISPRHA